MKLSKLAVALGSMLLLFNTAQANGPTTFLGPTLKGAYTSTITNDAAFSVLGEAGVKNFRAGGTLGYKLEQNQYVKVSAEYLVQKITYSFFSGETDQWVTQGAVGAGYLFELSDYCYRPHLDVNAYYSHAPSKSLSDVAGLITRGGVLTSFLDIRRIAGSNAAGIMPAVSIEPWLGARTGLGLNYDNVRYDKNYAPNEDAKGLGGTFTYNQVLSRDVDFGFSAAVRKPFNNYAAELLFTNVPYFGTWVLGVDGEYTAGKNTLPNTWNVGLSASYSLDQRCCCEQGNYKDKVVYKDPAINDDLIAYTADPAVYMPQVLAIPDELVEIPNPSCTNIPGLTGDGIPTLNPPNGGDDTSSAAGAFTGSGITFSISPNTPLFPGNTLSINPTTGLITAHSGNSSSQTVTATVTATTNCGSITAPVTINYEGEVG